MAVRGHLQTCIKKTMTKSSDLFTNQKEVDRAIQAAADQYELFNRSITQRKSRTPRTSKKGKPHVSRSRRRVASSPCYLSGK